MPNRLLAAALVAFALSGCASEAELAAAQDPPAAPAVEEVEWTGHILQGDAAELLSHQHPTADALWPVQTVGFDAEVPEGVTAMEVGLVWEGPGSFRIMLHSHNHDGGPSDIFMHVSEWSSAGRLCIRVPAEHVHPGMWEFMVRADGEAIDVDYTMTVLTVGGKLGPIDETHGHDRAQELQDGRDDTDVPQDACLLWQPGGHAH